jgi:hypothetical protein
MGYNDVSRIAALCGAWHYGLAKAERTDPLPESTLVAIGGTVRSNSDRSVIIDAGNRIEDGDKIEITAKGNLGV